MRSDRTSRALVPGTARRRAGRIVRTLGMIGAVAMLSAASAAQAQDQDTPVDAITAPPAPGVEAETAPATPPRPAIKTNRWQEDWSVLADPALRTGPLDGFKYIPIS